MKIRFLQFVISILVISSLPIVTNAESLDIPDNWSIESSTIYNEKLEKIGEFLDVEWFPYNSGQEFIDSFKKGFPDDPVGTKFISSGSSNRVYWVCRLGEYEDGKGGAGIWYSRFFWVKSALIVFYSYKSCQDNFEGLLKIAQTLK